MAATTRRMRLAVRGAVQGVGFRPTVHRLALEYGLAGWVSNSADGVHIDVDGSPEALAAFADALEQQPPPAAKVDSFQRSEPGEPAGWIGFEIRGSTGGELEALILPDLALCAACAAELRDPDNRRHRYAFTNCTDCGPRFSIIEGLPYDRPRTTMAGFVMCEACRSEYNDPADRRYHAQPNACPDCGPQLSLTDREGQTLARGDNALREAAAKLHLGKLIAVKGLGGFHLVCMAGDERAVRELRKRKRREEKPLAVMVRNLNQARQVALLGPLEEELLSSNAAPILLAPRRRDAGELIANSVVPGANPDIGLMLPYTPLHLLLLEQVELPIVATSGNFSDEPICIDNDEARERLGSIADLFLLHDRPIARHVDDSVLRVIDGEMQILRRARGYAPLPVATSARLPRLLGTGAHLKNNVALAVGNNILVSQHIGDLESPAAEQAFRDSAGQLATLYEKTPEAVACDLHPDYISTRYARELGLPVFPVQHHVAHVHACAAENHHRGPLLGVAWDGSGLGEDGSVWGGEFLLIDGAKHQRLAHLRPFLLPGGDAAAREPRRSALGLLWMLYGEQLREMTDSLSLLEDLADLDLPILFEMMRRRLSTPVSSSAGRLFDGVASLLGLRQRHRYEGQAAMELEWAAAEVRDPVEPWPLVIRDPEEEGDPLLLDWGPMLEALLSEQAGGAPAGLLSARFHESLAEGIVRLARELKQEKIALSGGCFLNRRLTERTLARARDAGLEVLLHRQLPPGDGCIAAGQVASAAARMAASERH